MKGGVLMFLNYDEYKWRRSLEKHNMAQKDLYNWVCRNQLSHEDFCKLVEKVDMSYFHSYGYFSSVPSPELIEELRPYLGRQEERRRKFYKIIPPITFLFGIIVGAFVRKN